MHEMTFSCMKIIFLCMKMKNSAPGMIFSLPKVLHKIGAKFHFKHGDIIFVLVNITFMHEEKISCIKFS